MNQLLPQSWGSCQEWPGLLSNSRIPRKPCSYKEIGINKCKYGFLFTQDFYILGSRYLWVSCFTLYHHDFITKPLFIKFLIYMTIIYSYLEDINIMSLCSTFFLAFQGMPNNITTLIWVQDRKKHKSTSTMENPVKKGMWICQSPK